MPRKHGESRECASAACLRPPLVARQRRTGQDKEPRRTAWHPAGESASQWTHTLHVLPACSEWQHVSKCIQPRPERGQSLFGDPRPATTASRTTAASLSGGVHCGVAPSGWGRGTHNVENEVHQCPESTGNPENAHLLRASARRSPLASGVQGRTGSLGLQRGI